MKQICDCVICHRCNGLGKVRESHEDMAEFESCDLCNGSGIEDVCSYCHERDDDD